MGSCVIQLNIFRNVTQGENYIQKTAKTFILTAFSAENVTRTRDLLITNQLLYRLSYFGKFV